VETGQNGGYPIQIHLAAEEILIQVRYLPHTDTSYQSFLLYIVEFRSRIK
jgi:hypothetical protein